MGSNHCLKCHGRGVIKQRKGGFFYRFGVLSSDEEVTCSACNGKGFIAPEPSPFMSPPPPPPKSAPPENQNMASAVADQNAFTKATQAMRDFSIALETKMLAALDEKILNGDGCDEPLGICAPPSGIGSTTVEPGSYEIHVGDLVYRTSDGTLRRFEAGKTPPAMPLGVCTGINPDGTIKMATAGTLNGNGIVYFPNDHQVIGTPWTRMAWALEVAATLTHQQSVGFSHMIDQPPDVQAIYTNWSKILHDYLEQVAINSVGPPKPSNFPMHAQASPLPKFISPASLIKTGALFDSLRKPKPQPTPAEPGIPTKVRRKIDFKD